MIKIFIHKKSLDLVRLQKSGSRSEDRLVGLLSTIFVSNLTPIEKKTVLSLDYNVPVDQHRQQHTYRLFHFRTSFPVSFKSYTSGFIFRPSSSSQYRRKTDGWQEDSHGGTGEDLFNNTLGATIGSGIFWAVDRIMGKRKAGRVACEVVSVLLILAGIVGCLQMKKMVGR